MSTSIHSNALDNGAAVIVIGESLPACADWWWPLLPAVAVTKGYNFAWGRKKFTYTLRFLYGFLFLILYCSSHAHTVEWHRICIQRSSRISKKKNTCCFFSQLDVTIDQQNCTPLLSIVFLFTLCAQLHSFTSTLVNIMYIKFVPCFNPPVPTASKSGSHFCGGYVIDFSQTQTYSSCLRPLKFHVT